MKFYYSLRFKLTVVIGILAFFVASLFGVLAFRISSKTVKEITDSLMISVADSASGKVQAETQKHFRMLEAIAKMDMLADPQTPLLDKCRQLTAIAGISDEYENIAFYDLEGNSFTAQGLPVKLDRVYIKNAAQGKRTIMDPAVNQVTNVLFQIYAVPVFGSNGKPIGCISANVLGEEASKRIADIKFGSDKSLVMAINKSSGNIIASTNVRQVQEGQNINSALSAGGQIQEMFTAAISGQIGVSQYKDPSDGMGKVATYRPVPDTDWFVLCTAPREDFFGPLDTMRGIMIALVIGITILTIILLIIIAGIAFKPLQKVRDAINDVASGDADLTKRIQSNLKDEIGEIVQGFNSFTNNLQGIIRQLKESKEKLGVAGEDLEASTGDTSASITQILANIQSVHQQINNQSNSVHQTAGAVNQIASNIESLERMIERQGSGVSEASAAVEQMIGNIRSVNVSVEKMSESFEELSTSASTGSQLQTDVNERITQIKDLSEALQEANTAIAAIADQTNLLAMNAAIEAAHAGDAGKGFSVVADEIRKLSETSSQQSKTIGEQLTNIQNSIGGVVTASLQSNAAFENVISKIHETDQIVRQIKAAMEEQNEGSQQISTALHTMNDSSLEVRNAGHEMAEGNKAILEEVRNLQDATGVMQNSMEEMSTGARKINETGEALRGIAHQMEDSIKDIGTQIDQFKV